MQCRGVWQYLSGHCKQTIDRKSVDYKETNPERYPYSEETQKGKGSVPPSSWKGPGIALGLPHRRPGKVVASFLKCPIIALATPRHRLDSRHMTPASHMAVRHHVPSTRIATGCMFAVKLCLRVCGLRSSTTPVKCGGWSPPSPLWGGWWVDGHIIIMVWGVGFKASGCRVEGLRLQGAGWRV